jgi:putative SOS response-associated peptidase YedK
MCGRFVLMTPGKSLASHFRLTEEPALVPRYNIAPTQTVPIIKHSPHTLRRALNLCRWGLVPFWAKDSSIGVKLINARSESVAEKPAFKAAFRNRRCLVPADGFYEWKRLGRVRQPYFFRMSDRRLFAFAGLWDRWEGPDNQTMDSFTVLTVDANELVAPVHDRMPLILAEQDYDLWLDTAIKKPELLEPLLREYPANLMIGYPVSGRVNKSDCEGHDLIEPLVD